MKLLISFVLALAVWLPATLANDISTQQYWELITDQNHNGWVDPGDIINNTLIISNNGKESLTLDVGSVLPSQLELDPNSIQMSTGKIDMTSDEMVIKDVHLSAPYGKTTVSYAVVVQSTPGDNMPIRFSTNIYNGETVLSQSLLSIKTYPTIGAIEPTARLSQTVLLLSTFLCLGVVLGVVYYVNDQLTAKSHTIALGITK